MPPCVKSAGGAAVESLDIHWLANHFRQEAYSSASVPTLKVRDHIVGQGCIEVFRSGQLTLEKA